MDGAWRSDAPFSLHGEPGEWYWDESHKVPVRKPGEAAAEHFIATPRRLRK